MSNQEESKKIKESIEKKEPPSNNNNEDNFESQFNIQVIQKNLEIPISNNTMIIKNITKEDLDLIRFLVKSMQRINYLNSSSDTAFQQSTNRNLDNNNNINNSLIINKDTRLSICYTNFLNNNDKKESTINNNANIPNNINNSNNDNQSQVEYNIPKKNKLYRGSLYDLFKSDMFTIHHLINYMDKFSDSAVFDCLVNEIYERFLNQCYFYLPQLCSMLVYKESYSLEQFLTEHCTDRMKFAVKINWLITSFKKGNSVLENKAVKIEIAMVNNKIKKLNGDKTNGELTPLSVIYQKSLSKEIRLNYFNKLCEFYDELTKMCDFLMKTEKEKREKALENYVEKLNINIAKLKNHINNDLKQDINSYFHFGYLLPFDDSDSTYDEETSLIVKILPKYCKCYTSKARVPVKLTFETVKVRELKNWDELIESDQEGLNYTTMLTDNGLLKKQSVIIEYDSIDDFLNKVNPINDKEEKQLLEGDMKTTNNQENKENKCVGVTEGKDRITVIKEKENIEMTMEDGKITEDQFIKELNSLPNYNTNTANTIINAVNCLSLNNDLSKGERKKSSSNKQLKQLIITDELQEINLNQSLNKSKGSSGNNNKNTHNNTHNKSNSKHDNNNSNSNYNSNNEGENQQKKDVVISMYNCKSNAYGLIDKDVDPKFNPFGKPWQNTLDEIKKNSRFRNFQTYQVKSYIYKSNDDLKQEQMMLQLIKRCQEIFDSANLPLKLGVYEILITSEKSGMIEVIPDTCSIDQIKKFLPMYLTLKEFFLKIFGMNYEEAQINFAQSLAAYSVVCYVFQIKDRHNGNILIDNCGHIIHIDFGFVLGINPGNINFESVPFKLTQEYIDILGGVNSEIYEYYVLLIMKGMMELRKYVDNFVAIIQIMKNGCEMPCFIADYFELRIIEFKNRFNTLNNDDYYKYARNLVNDSMNSWRTNKYDSFQKFSNGILY